MSKKKDSSNRHVRDGGKKQARNQKHIGEIEVVVMSAQDSSKEPVRSIIVAAIIGHGNGGTGTGTGGASVAPET